MRNGFNEIGGRTLDQTEVSMPEKHTAKFQSQGVLMEGYSVHFQSSHCSEDSWSQEAPRTSNLSDVPATRKSGISMCTSSLFVIVSSLPSDIFVPSQRHEGTKFLLDFIYEISIRNLCMIDVLAYSYADESNVDFNSFILKFHRLPLHPYLSSLTIIPHPLSIYSYMLLSFTARPYRSSWNMYPSKSWESTSERATFVTKNCICNQATRWPLELLDRKRHVHGFRASRANVEAREESEAVGATRGILLIALRFVTSRAISK